MMKRTAMAAAVAVSITCMLLAGCAPFSSAPQSVTQGTVTTNSSNTAEGGNSTTGQTDSSPAQSDANSTGSNTASGTGAGTASNTAGSVPSGNSQGTVTSENKAIIAHVMQLGRQGQVSGFPVAADTGVVGEAEKVWGKPSSQSVAGAGIYASFANQAAAIGFNKGDQIFDLRSYSHTYQNLTMGDVEQTLGTPGAVRTTSDSKILLYTAGPKYQVLWVFPNNKGSNPHVNHISVFYPEGTINMMAQDVPNPSIIVDQSPGSVGTLFTFSVQNAPSGYHLAELVWLKDGNPDVNTSVVTTFDEAVKNGQSGGQGAYFEVSGDGTTWSFVYSNAEVGQSGKVKLIYQNTNGAAIVGQSQMIHLK